MKYAILSTFLILNAEAQESDSKRQPVVAYFAVNTSSSSINGYEMQRQPVVYQMVPQPQYQQPQQSPTFNQQPAANLAQLPQRAFSPQPTPLPETVTLPAAEPLDNTTINNNPQPATPSATSLFSMSKLVTQLKNTAFTLNPITIGAGAVATLYAVYLIKLYNMAQQIHKKNTWSTWKEHIPLEVMVEVPHQEVAEELFNAIKTKYLPIHNTDLMTPILKFNNAVDHELAQLNQFLHLHDWLSYTKLSYIFPKYEMEIFVAKAKIKRLIFLKDILMAWMSDYSSAIMHDKFIPRFNYQRTQPDEQQSTIDIVAPSPVECI